LVYRDITNDTKGVNDGIEEEKKEEDEQYTAHVNSKKQINICYIHKLSETSSPEISTQNIKLIMING
jgi:hypothetical protein